MEMTLDRNVMLDDQQLMNGILEKWPDALDRLYRRYRVVLKSIIMQVLHDEAEADDVLQEVFLQVWNRAPSYSAGKGKLLSWLCTLARRRAIDRLRQHAAYRRATDRYEVSCKHFEKDVDDSHSVERQAFEMICAHSFITIWIPSAQSTGSDSSCFLPGEESAGNFRAHQHSSRGP